MTKLWVKHKQVSLKPMHKVKVRIVTLTFDLATWFLFATSHFVIMIICAIFFPNPKMQDKVIGWIQTGFTVAYAQSLSADCDLNL